MNRKVFSIAFGQFYSITYNSKEPNSEFKLVENKKI